MKTHPLAFRSQRFGRVGLACLVAAALPACIDAEPRDLGFTQSTEELSLDDPNTPFFSPTSDFIGRWVGSAQETLALTDDGLATTYRFPSGSTQIRVDIVTNEIGYLEGRIVFGSGTPLPPPMDADATYPAGVGYQGLVGYQYKDPIDDSTRTLHAFEFDGLPPFEGFEYRLDLTSFTIDEGTGPELADGVATLSFNSTEPLDPWCKLQTPLERSSGGYSCAPDFGGSWETFSDGSGASCNVYADPAPCEPLLPDFLECATEANYDDCDFTAYDACTGATPTQVNCDKLFICRADFCQCDSQSCNARWVTGDALSVRRVGDELIGLFANTTFKNARGLNVPLGEVRFHLEP